MANQTRPGMDHDLYRFQPIIDRPQPTWPGAAPVALWVVLYLEYWELDPPEDPTSILVEQCPTIEHELDERRCCSARNATGSPPCEPAAEVPRAPPVLITEAENRLNFCSWGYSCRGWHRLRTVCYSQGLTFRIQSVIM